MSVLNDVKYLNSSCKTPVWRWRSCLSKQMNHMAQTLCSILWNVSDLEYNFNSNLFKCIEWSETAGTKHCFGKWGGGQTCPKSWQAKNEKNKKSWPDNLQNPNPLCNALWNYFSKCVKFGMNKPIVYFFKVH